MNPISVLLVEDHMMVREGLRSLLTAEKDITVAGEAATGHEAVTLTRKLHPAVVVMDIAMPGLNGLEATRQILKISPRTRVLVLSAHGDEGYVEQMLSLGVAGYLLKQDSAHVLAEAVRKVHAGKTFFSPTIARRLRDPLGPVPDHPPANGWKNSGLSSREVEVLQLIAEGQANKQIASDLGISVKTVEKHRQRVMERLNIHNTAGLTRYAIAAGIVESSVQLTILPETQP